VSYGGPVKHRGLEINASLEGEEGTWESLERSERRQKLNERDRA